MQTLETTDPREAMRCRIAQYSGTSRKLTIRDASITGFVRSIREDRSGTSPTWIITILPRDDAADGLGLCKRIQTSSFEA